MGTSELQPSAAKGTDIFSERLSEPLHRGSEVQSQKGKSQLLANEERDKMGARDQVLMASPARLGQSGRWQIILKTQ